MRSDCRGVGILFVLLGLCRLSTPSLAADTAADHHRQGNADCDAGRLDRAIMEYSQAIRLRPRFAEAYCDRGIAYRLRKDYLHALSDFEKAIRLRPHYAAPYNHRAYTLRLLGRYDQAIAAYQEAIRISPRSGARWLHLGACQSLTGRNREAIVSYRKALALDTGLNEARFNLGLLYAIAGEGAKAQASYRDALKRARPADVSQAMAELEAAQKKHPHGTALKQAIELLQANSG
jgi:protein O-GlcNAc transferase